MSQSSTTIESALSEAARKIAQIGENPRLEAEALLAWVLGTPRSYLFAHPGEELPDQPVSDFSDAVSRRERGEPIAYITGSKEFWSLQLNVSKDTLVPRPETETLVELAIRQIPEDRPYRVLDLGTGSGAIAIAIASERPKVTIDAVDSSGAALKVAKENAKLHNLQNIRFVRGNWTEPVGEQTFDLVVSNPPYVCDGDPALDTLRYEPQAALAAGPDGMDAIRQIVGDCKNLITADGALMLEHGADQQDAVQVVLQENGWRNIACFKDLAGHPRVTTARMSVPPLKDQS